ncbi:MAG: hypothetical protein IKE51_01935 [Solobacterium sp.]|nr:hypothetical protein [Solobacterium sp.]
MSDSYFDIDNTEVQMTLVIKLQQLQHDANPYFTYQNLEDYMENAIWSKKKPHRLSDAVNDIMQIEGRDLIKYLAKKALTNSASSTLDDFTDLIRR